jgi:hypothetical protein
VHAHTHASAQPARAVVIACVAVARVMIKMAWHGMAWREQERVERIVAYSHLDPEPPLHIDPAGAGGGGGGGGSGGGGGGGGRAGAGPLPPGWPARGEIVFRNVSLRYRYVHRCASLPAIPVRP